MIIGIISDTHDHLDNLQRALNIFIERQVVHIIHAGDFTSPFTARVLMKFQGGFTGIFGNNDGDKLLLSRVYEGKIYTQPYIFNLYDRKIVVMHEPTVVDAVAESGYYDLVIYGHTHKAEIRQKNKTLIVNPGEVGGWLYGRATAATINLKEMKADIFELK
ncbi:MAG: metallophosphoesterase [Thermodesulfovibrionales bacterium]|nr:metallophosphoesterase [Thermodesulfovibrionales bacterium]